VRPHRRAGSIGWRLTRESALRNWPGARQVPGPTPEAAFGEQGGLGLTHRFPTCSLVFDVPGSWVDHVQEVANALAVLLAGERARNR